jgi:ribonuclease P protein subunit RPR2
MGSLRDDIARERISILLSLASEMWGKDQGLSRNYVKRAFDIKKKFRVRISREEKFSFCRKCLSPLIPGKTVSIAFDRRNKRVVYSCKICNNQSAFKYKD